MFKAKRLRQGAFLLCVRTAHAEKCLCTEIQVVHVACMTRLGSACCFLANLLPALDAAGVLGVLAIMLALNDIA